MRILFDYPWYWTIGCVLVGAAYAALSYSFRDKGSSLPRKLRLALGSLRFVAVSLIALLLLAPMIRRQSNQKEKPIILVATDRSESLNMTRCAEQDSAFYADGMEALLESLERDYDVQRTDYGDKVTDMGAALTALQQQYDRRNVGAMILTGDGLWNAGANPASVVQNSPYPIYTIPLGDTMRHRDASITHVRCGRIAYLGNQFPLEVTIRASRLKGERKRLSVVQDGQQIFSKEIHYEDDDYSTTEQLAIDARKAGMQRFTIRIETSPDEISTRNNERTITVEVIDGHQKIAIIAAAPHPDVAALKHSIETNQNYEVESFVAKDFKGSVDNYSLVILHQIPSRNGVRLQTGSVPCIYVLGGQSDIPQFNNLHTGLEIVSRLSKTNEAAALMAGGFSLFSLEEPTVRAIEDMPPLNAPFGDYRLGPGMSSLFNAKIGTVDSKQPLIALGQQQGVRRCVIAGEGLWRWRLADYQAGGSHEHFDELVNKLVVFTSMRVDKERFRLVANNIYRQDENVVVEAELYDENYEMVNTPEATLQMDGSDYAFNRNGSRYYISLGQLEPGVHTATGRVRFNGKDYTSSCTFVVEELNLEELQLTADHALMEAIAQGTGGQMVMPAEAQQIAELIRQRDDIKPIIYSHTAYTDLLDSPWLLILIILLLGIEWVARKYNGEM